MAQRPHERLLPLQNWTEKRLIFSNTRVHSSNKLGNRISRNVWPFEKLRVKSWQICLNTTGRIFIILSKFMAIFPILFDHSKSWSFILAQDMPMDTPFSSNITRIRKNKVWLVNKAENCKNCALKLLKALLTHLIPIILVKTIVRYYNLSFETICTDAWSFLGFPEAKEESR